MLGRRGGDGRAAGPRVCGWDSDSNQGVLWRVDGGGKMGGIVELGVVKSLNSSPMN